MGKNRHSLALFDSVRAYSHKEQELLMFVSSHIAQALEKIESSNRLKQAYAEMEALARRFLAVYPGNADAFAWLCTALQGEGKLAEADAACEEGNAIAPHAPNPLLQRSALRLKQGRLDEAERHVELLFEAQDGVGLRVRGGVFYDG